MHWRENSFVNRAIYSFLTVMEQGIIIPEPKLSKLLFADTRFAWIWLVLRLYVGWEWLTAGWEKVQNPAWFGGQAGSALQGF